MKTFEPSRDSVFAHHPRWQECSVPDLFSEQASLTPGAIALSFQGQALTYQELEHQANQMGHYLQSLGIGPEKVVALFQERGNDKLVTFPALLGIWKAGGAYLALSLDEPGERLEFILEESAPSAVLTLQRFPASSGLPGLAAESQIVCLDDPQTMAILARLPTSPPLHAVAPTSLAYVIYTSGSTGRPKGVLIDHTWLAPLTEGLIRAFRAEPHDRLLHMLPLGFDASLSELLTAWLSGATLYPLPAEAFPPAPGLVEFLQQQQITVAQIPPSLLPLLAAADLPALKTIATGGDRFPRDAVRALVQKGVTVVNNYGLTESVISSVVGPITGEEPFTYPQSYLGHPLSGNRVLILNEDGVPLPPGEPGEIALSPTARGYVQSALDTGRFFHFEGRQFCRTGDQGLIDPESRALIFMGRLEVDSVKLPGGELVALAGIEAELLRFRGGSTIQEGLVLLRDDPDIKQLVAYIVLKPGQSLDPTELRMYLLRAFPPFHVPTAYVVLPALQRTELGKATRDQSRYPAPTASDGLPARPLHRPKTPVELQLAHLVVEVGKLPSLPETLDMSRTLTQLGFPSSRGAKLLKLIVTTFRVSDLPFATYREPLAQIAAAINERLSTTTAHKRVLWLHNPRRTASIQLICFPPAGGNFLLYDTWGRESGGLSQDVELWAVELPRTPSLIGYPALIATLTDAITQVQRTPHLVLCGHSLGALLAWGVAAELCRRGAPPLGLVVIGAGAPQLLDEAPPFEHWQDREWQAYLRRQGGTPDEILEDAEELGDLIAALKSDFATRKSFAATEVFPLPAPIAAYGGRDDQDTPQDQLEGWQAQTQPGHLRVRQFPGGHFFLHQSEIRPLVLETLAADMHAWLGAKGKEEAQHGPT